MCNTIGVACVNHSYTRNIFPCRDLYDTVTTHPPSQIVLGVIIIIPYTFTGRSRCNSHTAYAILGRSLYISHPTHTSPDCGLYNIGIYYISLLWPRPEYHIHLMQVSLRSPDIIWTIPEAKSDGGRHDAPELLLVFPSGAARGPFST